MIARQESWHLRTKVPPPVPGCLTPGPPLGGGQRLSPRGLGPPERGNRDPSYNQLIKSHLFESSAVICCFPTRWLRRPRRSRRNKSNLAARASHRQGASDGDSFCHPWPLCQNPVGPGAIWNRKPFTYLFSQSFLHSGERTGWRGRMQKSIQIGWDAWRCFLETTASGGEDMQDWPVHLQAADWNGSGRREMPAWLTASQPPATCWRCTDAFFFSATVACLTREWQGMGKKERKKPELFQTKRPLGNCSL